MASARGKLITVEGIDGVGKSTLAAALRDELQGPDRTVELLREPGGVVVAERVRTLVKDPALHIAPRAEALLYAAARAQLVEEALRPLLERGRWVLLDRFVDSSIAYQGYGRGLGTDVATINEFATGGLRPDLTLLLWLTPEQASERSRARGEALDRLEAEGEQFFSRIIDGYRALAAAEPQRIAQLDASQAPDAVLRDALRAVSGLL